MENEIQMLKEQIKNLKKQNSILLDAINVIPDYVSGIMFYLKADKKIEALKEAEKLHIFALNAMSTSQGGPKIESG